MDDTLQFYYRVLPHGQVEVLGINGAHIIKRKGYSLSKPGFLDSLIVEAIVNSYSPVPKKRCRGAIDYIKTIK